jgi:hypothetical protein
MPVTSLDTVKAVRTRCAHIVYYDIDVNEDGTISIYIGRATGAQGFVQRLDAYDTAMRS